MPKANPIVQFTPPIGLAYVAGALRAAGHTVNVIDGLGEALDSRYPAKNDCYLYGLELRDIVDRVSPASRVIGISASFSFEWPTCMDLVELLRHRFAHAVLIAGGEHVAALPEYSLVHSELDVVVMGEGEKTVCELICAIDEGRALDSIGGIAWKTPGMGVRRSPPQPRIRDINEIATPAWDLIPLEGYLDRGLGFGVNRGRSMPVLASRGCPFQCTFCSSPQMWTTRWTPRNPDLLLDELAGFQRQYGIVNFDFYDLTAIVKKKWIVEFCTRIMQRKLMFTWQLPSGTRSEAIDAEVATLLFRSGCRNLSYSPESGSPSVLQRIKKKVDLTSVLKSIRSSYLSGINVKCNLIIGFPGEAWSEIAETFYFIIRLAATGCHDLSIWVFSPYPGSELFDDMVATKKIELNEEYFDGLRSYADATKTKSFSDVFSNRQLKILRRAGTSMFYIFSWIIRPWRPFVMLRNVLSGRQESRSELAISTMLKRLRMN